MSTDKPKPNPDPQSSLLSTDHISTRLKGKTQYSKETPLQHQKNVILNIKNPTTRPKCSSFHSKKDFRFQGNVNFKLNSEKEKKLKRSATIKREETNNSECDMFYSKLSIDTENDHSSKFQQVNIFNNPKVSTPKRTLTLKKSFSNQRPSVVSIFSRIKKKAVLKLSDEEDFKVF